MPRILDPGVPAAAAIDRHKDNFRDNVEKDEDRGCGAGRCLYLITIIKRSISKGITSLFA